MSETFSIRINGQWEHSGLLIAEAESLAAEYRLEGEKYVLVVPDSE